MSLDCSGTYTLRIPLPPLPPRTTRFLGTRGRNDCKKALCAATKYMIGVVVIVALVAGILFAVLGQSDVPVKSFEVRERERALRTYMYIHTFLSEDLSQ